MEILERLGPPMRNCGCHSHNGFQLSPEGLAQREYRRTVSQEMGLREGDLSSILDKVRSVSALDGDGDSVIWNDSLLEDQLARHLFNG